MPLGGAWAYQADASVTELTLDLADGVDAYQVLRGEWMVAQYTDRLDRLHEFGANLAGNIKSGLALTSRDLAVAERKRAEIWHRLRRFFNDYDLLLTPTVPVPPFPVEKNYPTEIGGRKLDNYTTGSRRPLSCRSLHCLPPLCRRE